MQKVKDFLRGFIKTRSTGFYFASVACAISLLTFLIYLLYGTVGGGQQYFSLAALLILGGSMLAFAALCLFKQTANWAPLAQAALIFVAFLVFIYSCYRYFTTIFYSGFSFAAIGRMNGMFTASLILFFLSMVLSQIGVHMKQYRTNKEVEVQEEDHD